MSQTEPRNNKHDGLRAVAADATGFGAAELRMTRDLILRPGQVMRMQDQPDSPYPKPLKYYLTLNGLYLLLIALLGGFEGVLTLLWTSWGLFDRLVDMSGKSLDSFRADLDQWYSLVTVPIIALVNYPPLRWLFRRWSNDRRIEGQVFTFLSGWTLLGMIPGLIGIVAPSLNWIAGICFLPIFLFVFSRMGRDVWWRTRWQFVRRATVALMVIFLVQILITSPLVMAVSLTGATFGP